MRLQITLTLFIVALVLSVTSNNLLERISLYEFTVRNRTNVSLLLLVTGTLLIVEVVWLVCRKRKKSNDEAR